MHNKKETTMKKAIFYIRCSTVEQEPALQIRDLDSMWTQQHEVLKENKSAWTENTHRPVFDSLLERIKKGNVSDLFVWDLDRIYRNRKRLQEFFVLCKAYGCRIHSYRQQWLEDIHKIPAPFNEIMHDLLLSIMGWLVEEESAKKSERVKMAIKKREDGTYSYRGKKWGRKGLSRQVVDRILELHRAGRSLREIASSITVYDKNKNERSLSKSAVHKTLVKNAA
jgi:DNA invertase Pin-like site-specific DNA recombinase